MRRILFLVVAAGALACGGTTGSNSSGSTQPTSTTPAIGLSPANATFSAVAGAASPAPSSVAVTNAGTGSLSGLAVGTITYGAGQTGGWLAGVISGATAPTTVTLTPATSTLLAGTYTALVPVTSSTTGVANSPQSVSVTLTVTAGTATKLVFGSQPTTTNGGSITPAVTVAVEDALGNVVTSSNASVTIAIGSNSGGGTLTGATTVAAVAGVATFANLAIAKVGTGYTLTASAAGLTGATSSAFNVTAITANTTLAAAGQSSAFVNSPNFSATLAVQPGSQYLVAVVNTDPSYGTLENFSLTGSFASSTASADALRMAGTTLPLRVPAQANGAPGPTYTYNGPSLAMLRQSAQFHSAVLEHDRAVYAAFGSPTAAWARMRAQNAAPSAEQIASGARQGQLSASISQTVGTVQKVYVLNNGNGNCTTVDSIGARTVAVGQHVIVLADTNTTKWPNAYRPDTSFYQTFANEYDQVTWQHLLTNIGDPLAYDAQLSSIGKVTVTITPTLNTFKIANTTGTVVAFVNSCDFYPYVAGTGNNADYSNQTEMFYSLVPSSTGYSVATWENAIRATAAHETKHIVSFANRFKVNAPFELIWLEEGLAQESSEIWERNFNQATWKGNATFAQTVDCELALGEAGSCDPNSTKPFALVGSHLPFLFQYLQAESSSNGEGLGLDTPSNYGAGWEFARWATDQYATGTEGPFIKSLITEPALTGLNNLAAHTGQSVPLLLTYWNVATATFQNPKYVAADVRTTIPSFNFANIDSIGQTALVCGASRTPCGIFTASGSASPTFPIAPIAVSTAASFSKVVSGVPGTSASYFLLSGTTAGIETINLLSSGGAALPSTSGFRVLILRVQ
jgi:hypothetical protein